MGTETWLNSSIKDNEIITADFNYKIYRKDRSDGYDVLLAISDHIASFPIPELLNDAKMVWAKVCIIGCKDLYISAYYRPHIDDNLSLELLDSALYKLNVLNKNAIIWISGDFNAANITWETKSVRERSLYPLLHEKLLDILMDHALSQLVHSPTRLNDILDLFITNLPALTKSVDVIPGISDHDIVLINSLVRSPILKQEPNLFCCIIEQTGMLFSLP